MATNPMQRKARNSFLAGMLITLVVAVIVSAFLVYQIMDKSNQVKNLQSLQKVVYVVGDNVTSGAEVNMEIFTTEIVQTSLVGAVTPASSDLIDKTFYTYSNEDGAEPTKTAKKIVARNNIEKGTIVTEQMLSDMFVEVGKEITDYTRLMEYNMIQLPTELVAGNTIDIRLSLPNGSDYIVTSKKYVEKANLDTIWIKMDEDEIITLGSAIIESYIIQGAKLYATTYIEAGIQGKSTVTYQASAEVYSYLANNPNILSIINGDKAEDKEELLKRIDVYINPQRNTGRDVINSELGKYSEERDQSVASKVEDELNKTKTLREQYLTELGEI